MALTPEQLRAEADRLYEAYVRSLEAGHLGEYVAVAPDGRVLLAPTLIDVAQKARASFGPGSFLFKVGDRAVGRWR